MFGPVMDGGKGSGRKDTPDNAELVKRLRSIAEYDAQQRAAQKAKNTGARIIRKLNEKRRGK